MYPEGRMPSGFFLKKKPPRTKLTRARELENCSNNRLYDYCTCTVMGVEVETELEVPVMVMV
jgi:hypothetical protein